MTSAWNTEKIRRFFAPTATRQTSMAALEAPYLPDSANPRTDREIASAVERDLEQCPGLELGRLRVLVERGVVRLQGHVESAELSALADELAWRALGVRDVLNEIVVSPAARRAGDAA